MEPGHKHVSGEAPVIICSNCLDCCYNRLDPVIHHHSQTSTPTSLSFSYNSQVYITSSLITRPHPSIISPRLY